MNFAIGTVEIAVAVLITVVLVIAAVALWRRSTKKKALSPRPEAEKLTEPPRAPVTPAEPRQPAASPAPAPAPGMGQKLEKTRSFFRDRLGKLLGDGKALNSAEIEQLEEVLLEADVGVATTGKLLEQLKGKLGQSQETAKNILRREVEGLFDFADPYPLQWSESAKPLVISVVGVNGAGKTTTVGKLAHLFSGQGKKVLLGAVDTFRAAAIEQLKVWADRSNADFVSGREGADPGAVAFDSVTAGKARGADVVLLDTAGRLHTKVNLMDELKKVHRVIKKVIPEAPHQTWLVLDGTLGQNSVQQAKEFQKALDLTGVIVTKLDGTAKGGAVLSISSELKLPVRYIGIGESLDDFLPFQPKRYVDAILGET